MGYSRDEWWIMMGVILAVPVIALAFIACLVYKTLM